MLTIFVSPPPTVRLLVLLLLLLLRGRAHAKEA
jgi:hypothetical protein